MKSEEREKASWLHFRVPTEMYELIKTMAEEDRRSVSRMALLILEDGLKARRDRQP